MQVNEAKLSNSLNRPYILASILGKKAFRGSLTDKNGLCHSNYGLFGTWKKQVHRGFPLLKVGSTMTSP
jgi:hypothetical protein